MREGVRLADVRHPIKVAAELPTEPAMPPTGVADHRPHQIGTHDAEGFRTHSIPGDVCLGCSDPGAGRWVPISQCPRALAVLDGEGTLSIPESLAIPARFAEPDVTDFDTDARPPGVPLPESLGGVPDWIEEHGREIDDHLRDMRQGLVTVLAELDQIGESTQALLSSRLYWVEFTETADGPDFATELANVATKARHLQRILAAAEGRSSS